MAKTCHLGLCRIKNFLARSFIVGHYYAYYPLLKKRIFEIMQYHEEDIALRPGEQEEHALPGFRNYLASGYYKYMLGRYLFSVRYIAGKTVLDAGCGLGWGSHLVSPYPAKIIAIDNSGKAINFARRTWQDPRVDFIEKSATDMNGLLPVKFDVILAFELVEHLGIDDSVRFLRDCCLNLNNRGKLILSSYFPQDEKNAREEEKKNIYHKHIFSRREILALLDKSGFAKASLIGDLMIVACKIKRG